MRRWMISGPEIARIIEEFENVVPSSKHLGHHEQTPHIQISFKKDVMSLTSEIEEQGNPFEEEGEYLIALHNKDIMDTAVVQTTV
ncbi:hypothetical protein QZH41_005782 [Actinostola sp. cb2023]|nr:hypothetical protein QZH41_005782 [Actinostola sp. cb2023]